jgi:hypothetical protein
MRRIVLWSGFSLLVLSLAWLAPANPYRPQPALAGPGCAGPWAGPAGLSAFPSAAELGIELIGVGAEKLTLYDNSTRVLLYPPTPMEIPTEIVAMDLVGTSSLLGQSVTVTLSPTQRSLGCVTPPGGGFPRDSFFDVFVELQVDEPVGPKYHTVNPVPVDATIYHLPPIGDAHMFMGGGPGGGDRGVRLFDALNQFVGSINLVKHIPLEDQPAPSWTIASTGPNSTTNGGPYHPADILGAPGGPPIIGINCPGLGLSPVGCAPVGVVDDVDGLAYGDDFDPLDLLVAGYVGFSVRPGSIGVPASAVNGEASCAPPEPQSDEFGTLLNGNNYQIYDGDGVPCAANAGPKIMRSGPLGDPGPDSEPPLAGAPHDDIDGIDKLNFTYANVDYPANLSVFNAGIDRAVYFSLKTMSPTLSMPFPPGMWIVGAPATGASPADVLVSSWMVGVPRPKVYVSETALGLDVMGVNKDDDIDGICLRDASGGPLGGDDNYTPGPGGDFLMYSLAAGSASLTNGNVKDGLGLPVFTVSPSDIIWDNFGIPTIVDPAAALGLMGSDDLDAMKCVKQLVDVAADGASRIVDPIGSPIPPSPGPPHLVTQTIGTFPSYAVMDLKVYQQGDIPEVLEQFSWSACRLVGINCVVNDPILKISWQWQPGDQCTVDALPNICPQQPLPSPPALNDLHFNGRVLPAITPFQRQLLIGCKAPGNYPVRVRLDQTPLGADDVRPQNNNLQFDWNVNCIRDHKTDANSDGYSAADEATLANCGIASCSGIITFGKPETATCKDAGTMCGTPNPPPDESGAARIAVPPALGYGCSTTLDLVPPKTTKWLAQSDIDLDGVVSILDLSVVAGWYLNPVNPSVTDPRWEGNMDGDGFISILDLGDIAGNYLRSVANKCKVE